MDPHSQQLFLEVIWDIFVLDLLILCLKVKAQQTLLIADFTNLFLPNNFKDNNKIISKYI